MSLYEIHVPEFGRLLLSAESKAAAREIAKRYRGWSQLRHVPQYRFCEVCDSRPCVCSKEN